MKDMSEDEREDENNNANANANANANDNNNDNNNDDVVPRQKRNYGRGQCNEVESANGEEE